MFLIESSIFYFFCKFISVAKSMTILSNIKLIMHIKTDRYATLSMD